MSNRHAEFSPSKVDNTGFIEGAPIPKELVYPSVGEEATPLDPDSPLVDLGNDIVRAPVRDSYCEHGADPELRPGV